MLIRKTTNVILALFIASGLSAQTTTAFRVNFNQALFDLPANAIEGLTTEQYVFAGTNMNFLPIYGTITEVDGSGNLLWSKRYYDGSLGFQINDIKKDASLNEYYVCGGSESNAAVFLRVNSTGAVVVSKKFSISEADGAYFNRIIKSSDGGYVAVGYVTGFDPDGAGPEMDFVPYNYTDANGDPQTEVIGSPLIVKMDADGNHLWHKVFRYYDAAGKTPTDRIYNDASLNDVVETSDGYIAVGSYDVNDVLSNTNSDGDDATANDAFVLKTDFSGTITYHLQYDALNFLPTQTSKYLYAINKTSTGVPIAAGSADSGKEWIIKFGATGGWSSIYSRLFTYSSSFFGLDPVEVSQIYEIPGSTDLLTMGMYVKPLSFIFSNSIHRINSTATTNVWAKYYTFSLATILPKGSLTTDNSMVMLSTVMGGADFDYHLIKTDPSGDTPLAGCAPVSFTPTAAAGTTTTVNPYYNTWSGTVGSQTLTVTVASITPTQSIQCQTIVAPCTPPTAPTASVSSQPTCSTPTGSVTLNGLPTSGTWTVAGTPSGTATGNTSSTTISGLAPGNYTFTVSLSGCTSSASNAVTISSAPTVPTAPTIGTITQPTCSVATGSVELTGLPASGTWTITGSPAGAASGSGTTTVITGLNPGTYTFTVNNGTCTSAASLNAVINAAPTTPSAPVLGTVTQPTCSTPTGSVDLSGLPGTGTWTVTSSNGSTITGSGATASFSGLTPGTYTFTVTNAEGCTSAATSSNATINSVPSIPTAPAIGTITQPTCSVATGSVELTGLPASGTWTITGSPAGAASGSGTTTVLSGLNPGSYTFTVNNGTCTSAASLNAVINAAPTTPSAPVLGTVTQPSCSTPTGSVDLSGLPGTGTWTVTSSNGSTITGTGATASFTGLAPGTYTFTVTNAEGCTSAASSTNATINSVPGIPTAPAIGTIIQPTCSVATGSVELTGLPASGTWTITGSPSGSASGSGTTTVLSGLNPGTYTFTVNNGTCTSAASLDAVINAAPTTPSAPVLGTVTQPSCSTPTGSVDLSGLPGTGTWTVTSSNGSTITGTGATASFGGLAPGTYTFTVTNASGCTSAASSTNATINSVPGIPTAPVIGTITQSTCSVATGSVELTGLPASGTWTITGSPSGSASGSGTTTVLSGLNPGTYTFTVNNGTCTSAASLDAVINAAPTTPSAPVLGTVTQPSCSTPTGSVDLSGLPGTGTWTVTSSNGSTITGTGATASFGGLAPGTYTFTVTNASGCTSAASSTNATINSVPGIPTAPVIGTITQPTCSVATGSVELTGLPASGTWTITGSPSGSASGSGTTTVISGLTPGTYTFTVNNGTCTSAASLDAVINAAPTTPSAPVIGTVTQPSCSTPTGSVDLSGLPGTGTWTVTSSNGSTITGTGATATFNGLAPGTYTFTVTNASGCTSAASSSNATVNSVSGGPSAPVIGTITQPTCATSTGSVVLNGLPSTGNWTITASPGGATITGSGTSATFSGLTPGNYTFSVSTGSGSTSSIFSEDFEGGATGWTLNVSMGTEGTDPNFFVVNDNEGGVTPTGCGVANNGDQTLHVTSVFNPNGGAAYDAGGLCGILFCPQTNRQSETPSINTTGYSNLSLTFDYIARGQVGQDFASVWYNDGSGWQQLGAALQSPLCPSGQGQWTAYSAVLPASCENIANLKLALRWQNNDDGTGTDPSFAINNLIVYGLSGGCTSAPSTNLTILPPPAGPAISLTSQTDETCFGDSDGTATVNVTSGSGPYTYSWSPSGGSNANATDLPAGTYTVTVSDVNSCTSTLSVTIAGPAAILANATVTDVDCAGVQSGAISTAASGGDGTYSYSWTPGGETTSSITGLSTGTYTVTVTDGNNCTASSAVSVGTNGSLNVVATPAYTEINSGDSVALSVSGGDTYTWIPSTSLSCSNCSNPIASPITSTEYIVTGSDANGCVGQDTVFIKVNVICGEFYIPSVFSPNQSGPLENEQLCVFGKEQCVAELDFTVYNRWGEIVFQTNDIEKCWDGTHRDKPVNSGVFVYKLYVKLSDGSIIEQSGNTTLVR